MRKSRRSDWWKMVAFSMMASLLMAWAMFLMGRWASQPSYFPKYSLGVSPVIFLKRRVK